MQFPNWLNVYGDIQYRAECPLEAAEQVTFVNYMRRVYPDSLGALLVHIKNEGKRTMRQAVMDKANGMTKGAPDIIIPCNPPILIELKRRNHTKSSWQTGQIEYLKKAHDNGAFVVCALGCDAAIKAVEDYLLAKTAKF